MAELNTLTQERYIQFLSIDMTAFGGQMLRFVDTSTYATDLPETGHVTFRGFTWLVFAFQTGGLARGGENLVRPAVQVMDATGELYAQLRVMRFGAGAPVTLYRAFAEDVIANEPSSPFFPERYVLAVPKKQGPRLELELATHLDFAQRKFPGYMMTRDDFPGLGSALLRG
ncbi:MAG: hypothetical protein BGP16_00870 [Sphingobium sp. 66-54]|nr:MAG: hypothetical protein BGP16_00870 [Sphingobium sp. 66-54]